ncbi:aspartate--ammonia ligase [Lactobacillus sp. S2-2]|uniref:aspartate--ammonia ligase n=1 Tax=Lactobacillus sp. S2-2 TaxID=2692917 RepID=UPI001F006A84|nr:aspartate--ammonia ligase [Lactobacillus sp. S2-2]MCF6515579.1 aspartate--ammonia ligase [Lactobacillus sp. S2-2]
MHLIIPESYDAKMSRKTTQQAIQFIRDIFQKELSDQLNLSRLSAPMFVEKSTGLNDNLNGVEGPVAFKAKEMPDKEIEIVQSLAKWKRNALGEFGFKPHTGIYTNMNAIRKDEEDLDNIHSIYVDQWDWEKVIEKSERNVETLKDTVKSIFKVIKHMEHEVWYKYPEASYHLPDEIHFVTTQELEDRFSELTPKEREDAICKEYGAVFVMQIGDQLKGGKRHDGRAPDYDDWSLNGDILFWFEPLQHALEVSSMGIRVDEDALDSQLKKANATDRLKYKYHQDIMNQKLPYTIGGGIGQSRICMLLLGKAHVGEVQASVWPDEMIEQCEAAGIKLL